MTIYSLFATVPKGLEAILAEELQSLGVTESKQTVAGVSFEGDLLTAYRVCLWSRIANRVLLVLDRFEIKNQLDLYLGVQRVNWSEHFNPEGSLAVTCTAKNTTIFSNTHFAALKVKDAIVDQMRDFFGIRPSIDTEHPDIRINVFLHGSFVQIALDLSGESLHRRGYREISLLAPIKENLAAAILCRAGWSKIAEAQGSLIDPMCGSGTLLLEGAMIAADYAPGLLRDYFGFLGWKQHNPINWRQLCCEAEQRKQVGLKKMPTIVGFDQDRLAINAALAHIANAGLQNSIHVERRDIGVVKPAESWKLGLLVCNPPYGERLGDAQAAARLYQKFGLVLRENFRDWQAAIIISDQELGFNLGIRSKKPSTFFNGALECKLLRLQIKPEQFFIPKSADRITKVLAQSHGIGQAKTEHPHVVADYAWSEDSGLMGFVNRLKKNLRKITHWAAQQQVSCYRVYDADLPDYAVAIDIYHGEKTWLNVQEYEPPKTVDSHKANQRLAGILNALPVVFAIPREQIFLKIRRKQKNTDQYEKLADQRHFYRVEENGCQLWVNFEDYLDTGLFLDHRPLRCMIQQQAKGKYFLNLFAYTGVATVHAAVGGAKATTTIDMSNTYLEWAKKNLAINSVRGQHDFIQADCIDWLVNAAKAKNKSYDLIFLDPPTFSNSKRMDHVFDVQTDHVQLIKNAVSLLSADGVLYFSTNYRRFKMDLQSLSGISVEDISSQTIPMDFMRNSKIHYCWRIKK